MQKKRLYCGTFRTEIGAACEVGCTILSHVPETFAKRCKHFEPLGIEVDGCLENIALADFSILVDDSIDTEVSQDSRTARSLPLEDAQLNKAGELPTSELEAALQEIEFELEMAVAFDYVRASDSTKRQKVC